MQQRHLVVRVLDQDGNVNDETESWFRYYKFRPGDEDELFICADGTVVYHEPKEGDVIWFQLKDRILGAVKLLRTLEDSINSKLELWYRGADIRALPEPLFVDTELMEKISTGELWKSLETPS